MRSRIVPAITVALLCLIAPSIAQEEPDEPSKPAPTAAEFLPSPSRAVERELAEVDRELVSLVRAKRQAKADTKAAIDVRLDLQLLTRHLLQQVAEAERLDDATIGALLRARDLRRLTRNLNRPAGDGVNATAAKTIHDRTFALDNKPAPAVLSGLGLLALQATGEEVDRLPTLAYQPAPGGVAAGPARMPTVDEVRNQIRSARLPTAVQASILELAEAAHAADKSTGAGPVVRQVITLAKGLGDAGGEEELLDTIALLVEPRLRTIGEARLSALNEYADLLAATASLPATQRMPRLLAAARQGGDDSKTLLAALRMYFAELQRFESAPRSGDVEDPIGPAWTRSIDRLRTQFEIKRDQFQMVGRAFGTPDAGNVTAADFAAAAEELKRLNLLLAAVAGYAPHVEHLQDDLGVRPIGGLERIGTTALVEIDDPVHDDERDAADSVILGVYRLAVEWSRQETFVTMSDGVLAERRAALLKRAGDELATARRVGPTWLTDVERYLATFDRAATALADVDAINTAAERAAAATHLADWRVESGDLSAAFAPLKSHCDAVVATAGDPESNDAAWAEFQAMRNSLRPLIDLVADVAETQPTETEEPLHLIAARMQTPVLPAGRTLRLVSLALPNAVRRGDEGVARLAQVLRDLDAGD